MAYAKINSITNANMAKVSSIAKAAIGKIGSIDAPVTGFTNTYSLDFDGTDDRLVCGPASYEQCSIGFWVKTTNAGFIMIFGKENDNAFYIAMSSGKMYISNQMIGSTAGVSTFNDGNWHHLIITLEGSSGGDNEVKLYIDGSLDKTISGSNSYTNTTDKNIVIGGWTAASPLTFNGNIDEVSVWDEVVLDADAITQLYNSGEPIDLKTNSGNYDSASDLTNWWRMGDEDTYPTIQDRSTNSNDGTMTNMTSGDIETDAPSTSSWASTTALSFDGTNDHVTTTADEEVASKTYVWWMKATQTSDNKSIFSHDDGGGIKGGFFLNHFSVYDLSREYFYYDGSHARQWVDNSAQDDGNWHHWAVYVDVDDARNAKLYVDGSEVTVANTAGTDPGVTSWDPLKIGFGNSNYAAFILSEFAIFDGDKTGSIGTYYNSGTPWDMTGEDDLDLYYIFEEGSGTSVADSSTNDNAGTLVNSPTWVTDAP